MMFGGFYICRHCGKSTSNQSAFCEYCHQDNNSPDKTQVHIIELKEPKPDPINHPSHYTSHPKGYECIDVIQWFPYNIASAMKYLWRAGLKPGNPVVQDLKKAIKFLEFEIKRQEELEKKNEKKA